VFARTPLTVSFPIEPDWRTAIWARRSRLRTGGLSRHGNGVSLDQSRLPVLSEQRVELAAEFDAVHSVERAVRMGSASRIIPPPSLRQFLIDAVERGDAPHPGSIRGGR
jgi:hypothetical protein